MAQKKITGDQLDTTDVTASLNTFTTSLKGLAPASGGGATNYLRADGTWAAPSGSGGTVTSVGVSSSGAYSAALTIGSSPVTSSGTITITPNLFGTSTAGIVPASGGGTANYLRADGTWAAPAGIGTVTSVTLTQPAAGLTLTNSGVSQTSTVTSTFALANDLAALEGLGSTGIAVRTAADTWAQRTITGTANQITVTDGDGVSGNPTLSLPSAVTMPGTLEVTSTATFNGNVVANTGNIDIQGSTTPQLNLVASGGQTWTIGYNEGSSIVGYYDATGGNWGFYIGDGATGACTFPRSIASTSVSTGAIVNTGGMGNAGQVTMTAISTGSPTTKTANYSLTATDTSLIFDGSGSLTLTLQSAATYPGRWVYVKTIAAQTVVSASSNVVPLVGGAAGTAILAATAGKWAALQSDGTNWVIMMAN